MIIFRQSTTTRNVIAVSIIVGMVTFLTLKAMEPAGTSIRSDTTGLTSPSAAFDDASGEPMAMP